MYNARLQKVWNGYLFIYQRYQELKITLKRSLNTEPTLYLYPVSSNDLFHSFLGKVYLILLIHWNIEYIHFITIFKIQMSQLLS